MKWNAYELGVAMVAVGVAFLVCIPQVAGFIVGALLSLMGMVLVEWGEK